MRRRGFTLIELSTVIVILALFAAAVVPHMASAIEGSKRRSYRVEVLTLAKQGKEEAIKRGANVRLTYSDGTFQIAEPNDINETIIDTVASVQGIEASHFSKAGQEQAEGEWGITFYPDGTSDGGSFQFDEGQDSTTVKVDKRDARISVTDGAIDPSDNSENEWDAGGYEQTG